MFTFLSDEWIAEVEKIKATFGSNPVATDLVVNATITGVPFGEGKLEVHSDHGPAVGWVKGHSAAATLSITLDYQLARALVLDDSAGFDTLAQAGETGALQVVGEPGTLRDWYGTRVGNPELVAVEQAVRAITL